MNTIDTIARLALDDHREKLRRRLTERTTVHAIEQAHADQAAEIAEMAAVAKKKADCLESTAARRTAAAQRPA